MNETTLPPDRKKSRVNTRARNWLLVNLGIPILYSLFIAYLSKSLQISQNGLQLLVLLGLGFILLLATLNIRIAIALGRGKPFAAFFLWAGSTALGIAVALAGCAVLLTAGRP